jgi:outer membrane protein insertion porin family
MKKLLLLTILTCLPLFLFGQEVVEKIEIQGNDRVTRETILYYLTSREGEYFNRELLKRDFQVLWSTGFFSNIKIEENSSTNGKVIKIIVEENPIIKNVVYKTGKKVKQDAIVEKLKENDAYLLPYSYYSSHKIQKIEQTIQTLLLEKGLTAGKVKTEENKKGNNELEIVFNIDEGPKIRVGELE